MSTKRLQDHYALCKYFSSNNFFCRVQRVKSGLSHGCIVLPDPAQPKGIEQEINFFNSNYHTDLLTKDRHQRTFSHFTKSQFGQKRNVEWGTPTSDPLTRDQNPELRQITGLKIEQLMVNHTKNGQVFNAAKGKAKYRPDFNCFSYVNLSLLKVGEDVTTKNPVDVNKLLKSEQKWGANINKMVQQPTAKLKKYHVKNIKNDYQYEKDEKPELWVFLRSNHEKIILISEF